MVRRLLRIPAIPGSNLVDSFFRNSSSMLQRAMANNISLHVLCILTSSRVLLQVLWALTTSYYSWFFNNSPISNSINFWVWEGLTFFGIIIILNYPTLCLLAKSHRCLIKEVSLGCQNTVNGDLNEWKKELDDNLQKKLYV